MTFVSSGKDSGIPHCKNAVCGWTESENKINVSAAVFLPVLNGLFWGGEP
jgi:hypothetical protein